MSRRLTGISSSKTPTQDVNIFTWPDNTPFFRFDTALSAYADFAAGEPMQDETLRCVQQGSGRPLVRQDLRRNPILRLQALLMKARPQPHHAARELLAYHESGHAVLSAAINDLPQQVSIEADAATHGRTTQRMLAPPLSLAQIYLAGFAAEHLLTGRRPRQLDQELRFALLARRDPELLAAFAGASERDGHRAIHELLRTTRVTGDAEILEQIAKIYGATRDALAALWPAVRRVAAALAEAGTLEGARVAELCDGLERPADV